jgi:branched-chain amino acid transport system permease protein
VIDLVQTLVSGIALGAVYAVLALGFVVVVRASGILNLAQGTFVVLGAYLCYTAHQLLGIPFWVSVGIAMLLTAAFAILIEATIVHRVSSNLFTAILVTFGILIVVPPIVTGIWGADQQSLGDPWGLSVLRVGPIAITERDVWLIVISILLICAFFVLFRYTRMGLALRATAIDAEAALAQGISSRMVFGLSWGLAGALGAFGGVMLASTVGGGVRPGLETYALLALPVIILGGLDSPLGAVVGGLIIGVVQQFSVIWVPDSMGSGFSEVVPYIVMVIILLIRPTGLFGSKEVRRV